MNDDTEEECRPSLTTAFEGPIRIDNATAAAVDFDVLEGFMQAAEADNDVADAVPSDIIHSDYGDVDRWHPLEPTSFFAQEDQEERFDIEDDFFAENYEKSELPDHMKDQYLENFDKQMDANMTPQDFERSQFEVHGISTNSLLLQQQQEVDPQKVNKALHDLDIEIQRLQLSNLNLTELYRIAQSQSPEFVTNRNFRFLFLRSERFDIGKAAHKLMRYFQVKDEIWGRDKLTKKISLSDFDEHDWECLKHGHAQLLPIRDHAGRSVLFNNLNHIHYHDETNQMRTLWYLLFAALEDEDTQKNGIVFVQYKVGEQKGHRPNRQLLFKGATYSHGMPMIFGAFQLCFGRQSLPFVWLLKLALEFQASHRVRVHEGSQTEVLTTLMTFGIPRYAVPVSADGEVTTSYHLDWLEKRLHMEKEAAEKDDETSSSCVRVPGNGDVLLGRGKRTQSHPGNIRYNMLLEENSQEFDEGDRTTKRDVQSAIIRQIKASAGGRFLRCVDKTGWWEVVDEKDIRQKISHDFRTIRRKKLKSNNGTKEGSSVDSKAKKRAPDMPLSSDRQAHQHASFISSNAI